MKRYELLQNDTIKSCGKTLYRIRALIDMPEHCVNTGDLGGYIASEDHLTQDGTGWVHPDARVCGGNIHGGIIDDGEIWGGNIHGGIIDGGTIYGGNIYGGTVYGGRIYGGNIYGGSIRGGTVYGGSIHGGSIRGGTVYGGSIHGGSIHDGIIHGGRIYGGRIYGGIIHGGSIRGGRIYGGIIHGGEWHTSPLQIQGSRYYFNMSDNRDGMYYIQIGCQNHSVDDWREKWQKIAEDYDENDIVQEYARYFNLAAAMYGFAPVVIDGGAV